MKSTSPQVGNWYKEIQQGLIFEVVAVDENTRTIETQLIDGAVTEYDLENWNEMLLEEVEEPEDWRNAYELSSEDFLNPDDTIYPEDWNGPVSMIETDIVNGMLDEL
ncbi:MAG: hypothetical protein GY712_07815 [Oceanicoccus sp.]|uniref:DUF6763 family protein n=1 Tax=Oceanicoccus sp. TaxID=2691044 RepID=UPI002638AE98|nr:DUF6763 family protein [Oceanicoccus sp.]MCP3907908.1 hypothetical protein [Oceanicoccus sp.]MDG1773277.1 hypothetical protein [Oceanicoccus sp.]